MRLIYIKNLSNKEYNQLMQRKSQAYNRYIITKQCVSIIIKKVLKKNMTVKKIALRGQVKKKEN